MIAVSQRNFDIFKENLWLDREKILTAADDFFNRHLTDFPSTSCNAFS